MRPVVAELADPRCVSAPAGATGLRFVPWLEATLHVRVSVPAWAHRESTWVHWAVPVRGGVAHVESARAFDPLRRAASPGEPADELREEHFALDHDEAARLTEALVRDWHPELHRQVHIGLVSRLGEGRNAFRTRCLALFVSATRRVGSAPSAPVAAVSRAADRIETRRLAGDEIALLAARVRVGWYPQGIEPETAEDPMMSGALRRSP